MDNMNYIWLLLVSAVCLTLLIPADAWGVRRIIRRIRIPHPGPRWPKPGPRWPRPRPGPWLRNCETKYAVGCTADEELSGGPGSCKLTTIGCRKRELSEEEYLRDVSIFKVPFSKDLDDYDEDGDGFVDKDEFVEYVLSAIEPLELKDPEDMMIPFEAADQNDDGVLSNEELELSEHFYGDDDDGNVDDDENDDDNV